MLETSSSDLDVERLMHEIRATVARQRSGAAENSSGSLSRFSSNGKSMLDPIGSLSLQPAFQVKHDNQYHINELLKFHGEGFVRNAYRALLGREPDDAGLAHHLERLASGRFNKIDVLASLHSSPEGRRAQVKVAGLSLPIAIRRLGRVPLIGYLIRLLIAVGRLPLLQQHQREFEFYLLSQQQRIVANQNQGHKELSDALAQVSAQILAGMQRVTEQQQSIELSMQQHQELRKINEAQFAAAREYVDQRTIKLAEQIELQTHQLLVSQQRARVELIMQERRVAVLLEEVRRNPPASPNPSLSQLVVVEEDHLLDALYASFEDRFRGERDEVRQRLQVYLPILMDAQVNHGVLDIGCGRGEWLELLNSERIQGQGVDRNRVFIDMCRRAGLDVIEEDALVHLRSLPAESLNAVTSFHLVEHLQFEMLIKLLDEIVRTLRPGGLLILETPNPENFMVGSYSFYTDPTHRNPIPSQTLEFLLEARGLGSINILKLRPRDAAKIEGDSEIVRRFNEYFYSAPDYGIIARKP